MTSGRVPKVVDVNVAIVANRREGGTYACAFACAEALRYIRDAGQVVIDDGGHILSEYKEYLKFSGRPGLGDSFFRWFFQNRARKDLVCEVHITECDKEDRRFEEMPEDDELRTFDPSDQKYVAASQSHPAKPAILQASDHKWLEWSSALERHGTHVEFICEDELLQTVLRKARH